MARQFDSKRFVRGTHFTENRYCAFFPSKKLRFARLKRLEAKRAPPRVQNQDKCATIFVVRNARKPVSRGSLAVLKVQVEVFIVKRVANIVYVDKHAEMGH